MALPLQECIFEALAAEYKFSLDMPVEMLSKEAMDVILYGTKGKKIKMKRVTSYGSGTYVNDFEGVVNNLKRRYEETSSEYSRAEIETVMVSAVCPDCKGARLSPISLAVTVGGKIFMNSARCPFGKKSVLLTIWN